MNDAPPATGTPKPNAERNAAMLADYASGLTLQEVGSRYGVSREWVRQLAKAAGIKGGPRKHETMIRQAVEATGISDPPPGMVAVYSLTDPESGRVRYVGQTYYPARRLAAHISKGKYEKTETDRGRWIKELAAKGLQPVLTVLEEVDLAYWDEAEMKWIAHFSQLGEPLLNRNLGGWGWAYPPPHYGEPVFKAGEVWAVVSNACQFPPPVPGQRMRVLRVRRGHGREGYVVNFVLIDQNGQDIPKSDCVVLEETAKHRLRRVEEPTP